MKAKTIVAILEKRFAAFLESIDDLPLREQMRQNSIITGGSIVSLLLNQNVNDFDVYFRTAEVAERVARYYVAKFQATPPSAFKSKDGGMSVSVEVKTQPRLRIYIRSNGVAGDEPDPPDSESADEQAALADAENVTSALDEQPAKKLDENGDKYRPVFLTENAITLTNKFQLIIRFYGEPEEIHRNYDFVHCTNYWQSWDKRLVLRPEALESILAKELRYVGSLYPICSIMRTRKFIRAGWTINAGQFLKMAWQVNKLNLSDLTVLKDQLIGVDAAYFGQLIAALKKQDPATVDGTYLMSVIDRIF